MRLTDPFRSETEQLRVLLQRADEAMQHVLDEKKDLERQLTLVQRPRAAVATYVILVVVMTCIGIAIGSIIVGAKAEKTALDKQQLFNAELSREHERLATCAESRDQALRDWNARSAEVRCTVVTPACDCQMGDPLCNCPSYLPYFPSPSSPDD